jgi:hypothetical protein
MLPLFQFPSLPDGFIISAGLFLTIAREKWLVGVFMAKKIALVVAVCLGAAASLAAQMAVPAQGAPVAPLTAVQRAVQAPTDSDIYCAGFFTRRSIEPGLFVLGSEEGTLKNEFSDRDSIYLSKGRKWINAPGGQYMLIRPLKDTLPIEVFPGQHALVTRLGTLYAEVARIEVRILHEGSATAEILHSCEPVLQGDIAIPLSVRPAPPYRPAMFTDRFAPSSGKPTGLIAAIKEFQQVGGRGNIVYLDIGKKQGAQVGGYLRIFRTNRQAGQNYLQRGIQDYPAQIMGVPLGRPLTREEMDSLPRAVVGELMILSLEDESATGIITYSLEDIYVGDDVEIE